MANQEHLAILRRDALEWNRWRKQYRDVHPDLSETDLSHADLSETNLRETNLSYAFLNETNLSYADLRGADLSDADLSHAILIGANLSHAILIGATLSLADLSDANLQGADLRGAELGSANLRHAHLKGTDLSDVDLSDVDLSYTNLSHANLSNAVLSGAVLSGAVLSGAVLSHAILGGTVLGNVDLRTVKGLETVQHGGPSTIGTDTLERSHGDIPDVFLRDVGLSDTFIEYVKALVQKPIEYYTCFISYSSQDEMFAKRLYSDLQSEGVRCWFAPEDMDIGDKIQQRINESIRQYDKLLLILSKHSIISTWVAYEVERALSKEPKGVQDVLYPLRLDKTVLTCDAEWAQDIKQTRHIGNFEQWKTNHDAYQESFKRLLRALKPKDVQKAGR